eukprot:Skav220499  [mRNA]  locus=scaffold4697:4681:5784:- [translate_table: standard]
MKKIDLFLEANGLKQKYADFNPDLSSVALPSSSAVGAPGGDGGDSDDDNDSDGSGGGDDRDDPFSPSDPEDVPSVDDDDDEGVIRVYLDLSILGISRQFSVLVKPSWKPKMFKALVMNKTRVPTQHQRFVFQNGGQVWDHLTIQGNGIINNATLRLMLSLCGGAEKKTTKFHLKSKRERINKLVERATKAVDKAIKNNDLSDDEDYPPTTPAPPALTLLTQGILAKIQIADGKLNSGEKIIYPALEKCSDNQLQKVENIFASQKNHIITEDKLMATAEAVLEDIVSINQYRAHLKVLKADLLKLFSKAFAFEYSKEQNTGNVIFSCEAFLSDVKAVINYRKGLLRSAQANAEDELASPDVDARCDLM